MTESTDVYAKSVRFGHTGWLRTFCYLYKIYPGFIYFCHKKTSSVERLWKVYVGACSAARTRGPDIFIRLGEKSSWDIHWHFLGEGHLKTTDFLGFDTFCIGISVLLNLFQNPGSHQENDLGFMEYQNLRDNVAALYVNAHL